MEKRTILSEEELKKIILSSEGTFRKHHRNFSGAIICLSNIQLADQDLREFKLKWDAEFWLGKM